jgi:hypothetical protein
MRKNVTTLALLLVFGFSSSDLLSWVSKDWAALGMFLTGHHRPAPKPAPNKSHLTIPGSSPDGNG